MIPLAPTVAHIRPFDHRKPPNSFSYENSTPVSKCATARSRSVPQLQCPELFPKVPNQSRGFRDRYTANTFPYELPTLNSYSKLKWTE